MSTFKATVTEILGVDNLHIVKFNFHGQKLSMMSLELNKNIQVGSEVILSSKALSIAIAKEFTGEVSYSNRLQTKIINVENGELLTSVKLQINDTILESVITKESSLRMSLQKEDEVLALIKANELSIIEVLS